LPLFSKLMTILAIFLALLPSYIVLVQPVLMQAGDFLITFYPAGKLAQLGRIAEIYTPANMTTFINAPFDKFTHETFPAIAKSYVAIYMYSPLIALFFAPFALLQAQASLILWQLINVAAAVYCAWLFARPALKEKIQDLTVIFLFCPIFHTLLIGQLGILFGLLPLTLAYKFLLQRKEFLAGLVLGTLYMKPQFLPCALLVCGALFFTRRPKATAGLICGLAGMALLTVALTGSDMLIAFWQSIKMSDTCYSCAGYRPASTIITCLPAVILQFFDFDAREKVKLYAYGGAALIGLGALVYCIRLWRPVPNCIDKQPATQAYKQATALTFLIGLFVLPLVVPHFLFYDLCGLALMAFMVNTDVFDNQVRAKMLPLRKYLWWICNLYYVGFSFFPVILMGPYYPLILVILLAVLLLLIVRVQKPQQT